MRNLIFLLLLISCSSVPVKVSDIPQGTVLIKHPNLTILYDTINMCPVWSEYILTANYVKPPKREMFICDTLLPCRVQQDNEVYKQVNYWIKSQGEVGKDYSLDRGHLSPFDDLGEESMIFTNISFQNSYFNEHQWEQLEQHIRQLALENDTLIVRTGVIFKDSTINNINVPVFYWKRVIIKKSNDTLTWQMPNKYDDLTFDNYLVK
jgi:DNA/RNA endonuclease G (NUC1)